MTTFKMISYLLVACCVLQWSMYMVECSITTGAGKSKMLYGKTDDKEQGLSSSILGSIYQKSRQSRCVTCYEDRRYSDDRSRHYSSYAARPGADRARSWYNPSFDRYDNRGYRGAAYDRYAPSGADRYETDRYGADRYGADRYSSDRYGTADRYAGYRDDPYGGRPSYDRYDSRTRGTYDRSAAYDRGESRGYGFNNRDRYYDGDRGLSDYYGRDRYYERPRYGATAAAGSSAGYGGYDRDYYDRYSTRYDFRRYRPWYDTYRSQSRYGSNMGRGHYYAKGPQEDRGYLPEHDYNAPGIPRCGIIKPNCQYNSQEGGTRVTSGTIDSGHYNMGVSQTAYNTNWNKNHNESSKGSGSPANWSYVREDEKASRGGSNSGSNSNSERQSSGYGALLDRGSNLIAVEPANSNSNENVNNTMASSDMQSDKNSDETTKQSDNEENS